MKKKTLDRIFSTYSLFDYSKNCLNLLKEKDWLLCFPKTSESTSFRTENLFSINEELGIDYFFFNKKIFKKTILLCPKSHYNDEHMDVIKSNQLNKKILKYVEKWQQKLEKTIVKEWEKIRKTPKVIQSEYKKECMTLSDYNMIKEIRANHFFTNDLDKNRKSEYFLRKNNNTDNSLEDIKIEKEYVKSKVLKLKNKDKQIAIGAMWNIKDSEALSMDLDKSHFLSFQTNKNDSQEIEDFHCTCCKHKIFQANKETQSDNDFDKTDKFQQTDSSPFKSIQTQCDFIKITTINQLTQTDNIELTSGSQIQSLERKENKQYKTNFEHILSNSIFLGEPKTKKSRDLMTAYDEMNSILGKLKKVCGRRMLTTPETTYISYRLFEQFDLDKQVDLVVQYKAISTLYKKLRTEFIESKNDTEFTQEAIKALDHIQKRIFYLNKNIDILVKNNDEKSDDQITTLIELDDEQIQTKAEIKGLIGDYLIESTPQEGNSQQIMTLDDNIINSLML